MTTTRNNYHKNHQEEKKKKKTQRNCEKPPPTTIKPELLGDFLTTLTKFNPKSILGGPKNPNFDPAIRTG